MNTRELARAIEEKTGVKAYLTQQAITAMADIVKAQVGRGGTVSLGKLGRFKAKSLKAGKFKNMKTKEMEEVGPRHHIAFQTADKYKKI